MEELERHIQQFSLPNGSGGVETPDSKVTDEKNELEKISVKSKK